ncbi:MAG: hypothetical protein H8E12_22200 [Rhodobacteraceae bacterium]|nr:hypothetical protein [Paracoccaceae bacterium]
MKDYIIVFTAAVFLNFGESISINAENKYDQIHKRNAFALSDKAPSMAEVPSPAKPPVKLNLTGIIIRGGVTNVYMFSKDIPKKFLTLSTKRRTNSGVILLNIEKELVEINNNGVIEILSFDTHKLPSIITLWPLSSMPAIIKKKESKSEDAKILERIEKLQRGDYDKEIRERMKKYEEYKKTGKGKNNART